MHWYWILTICIGYIIVAAFIHAFIIGVDDNDDDSDIVCGIYLSLLLVPLLPFIAVYLFAKLLKKLKNKKIE